MIYMTADLHLIRYIWREKRELDGDSYRALHAMVDVVVNDAVDEDKLLILAGDVFDQNRIDGRTLNEFTKALDKLDDAGVSTAFIQGQHDRNEPPHALVQGAIWLNNRTLDFDGRRIFGLDWLPREELHEVIKEIPKCDILVLHAGFEHTVGFGMAADLSIADVPKRVRNILVGDIHIESLTDFRDGWCLSPGPLHPCNIAQGGLKHIWKLAKDEEGVPVPVSIPARTIIRTAITYEDLKDELEQALQADLAPVVELTYTMEQQEEAQKLMHEYKGRVVFFPKPAGNNWLEQNDLKERIEEEAVLVTMPQVINNVITSDKDPEMNRFMLDLWDGDAAALVRSKIESAMKGEDIDDIDEADFN